MRVTSLSAHPVEVYDQIHTQVIGEAAFAIEGLMLVMDGPPVWLRNYGGVDVSRAHYDRYQRELMASLAGQLRYWDASFDAGPDYRGVRVSTARVTCGEHFPVTGEPANHRPALKPGNT